MRPLAPPSGWPRWLAAALCAVPLEEGWARRQLRLITRPAAMLPPAARLLRDHLARPTSADGGR